jgi:murein endopeptidase
MGILDLSLPGGGPMPPHGCHENGLDVDVRYVKASEEEGPLDLTAPNLPTYSKPKTVELLQLFANTGLVELIYVHPNSGITPGDVSSVVVDPSITHRNHFHVRLIDPDGANSNNC